jgi:hypothetical protein
MFGEFVPRLTASLHLLLLLLSAFVVPVPAEHILRWGTCNQDLSPTPHDAESAISLLNQHAF